MPKKEMAGPCASYYDAARGFDGNPTRNEQ